MSEPTTIPAFLEWYRGYVRRTKGTNPPPTPRKSRASRARSILVVAGSPDLLSLAPALGDRSATTAIVDRVHGRMRPASASQTIQVLKQLGDYAVAMGWIDAHAVRAEDRPSSIPQKPIVTYTREECEAFIAAARGNSLRWCAFLVTLTDTGRRVGEVLSLRWDALHLNVDTTYFELATTKNKRQALSHCRHGCANRSSSRTTSSA